MRFQEKVDLAGNLAVRARIFFDVWWHYKGAPTRHKYIDTMNEYSAFFRFDIHAHFVALVMYLSQLFETRAGTLNLSRLVNDAASSTIPSSSVDTARTALNGAKHLASKVACLRSNLFAHRNLELSYADAFKRAAVSPDQLRELTEVALKVANTLAAAIDLKEKFFYTPPRGDIEALLEKLGSYT